jgi:hypothetical protein
MRERRSDNVATCSWFESPEFICVAGRACVGASLRWIVTASVRWRSSIVPSRTRIPVRPGIDLERMWHGFNSFRVLMMGPSSRVPSCQSEAWPTHRMLIDGRAGPALSFSARTRQRSWSAHVFSALHGWRSLRRDAALEAGGHVGGQAPPQEEPRPVHARLDRARRDAQRLGDLRIREAFDIVQEKGRAVVLRELIVDGATERRLQPSRRYSWQGWTG